MSERYDIYFHEHRDDNGILVARTWHIMDTSNRCADMGYTFTTREDALAICKRLERGGMALS
jgi:hypothetical protein